MPATVALLRIRSLEIRGFKSFAERTTLAFSDGISAVVGPNGCGKSNVIDALRWVMGEQNPRQLRGDSMEDMIFSGTEKRASVGMAEVVLTLDNRDGLAPEPYKGHAEIQVGRRLYRSGESEYTLNKTQVRLRDVTDFFLDTGVGTRGYTIVEQGHITDLVSTKPADRRVIFEQAAGIGKYRARRRETESKLRSTEQNLTRVNDILGELRRQIGSLDRQARKANRFKKLKARLRDVELVVAREQWLGADDALGAAVSELEDLRTQGVALDARVARTEVELEAGKRSQLEQERALQQMSERLYALRSEVQSLEGRIDYERREREGLERLSAEREEEAAQLETQLAEHSRDLSEAIAELSSIEERLSGDEAELERRDAELRDHSERLSVATGRREALQARRVASSADRAALSSRTETFAERHRELELRMRENEDLLEASAQQVENLRHDESGVEGKLRRALAERDELGRQLADKLRRLEQAREHAAQLSAELVTVRDLRQQVATRLEAVREIERREAQRSAELVAQLPDDLRARVRGSLAEVLQVDDGLEMALEAALAHRTDAIVVDEAEEALALLDHMRRESVGRSTVLSLDAESPYHASFVPIGRPLAEVVRMDERFKPLVRRLLHGVYLVDDLGEAVRRFGVSAPPATFVTRMGEVLDRSGALTGGLGAPPGSLSRAGEIRRLSLQQDSVAANLAELENANDAANADVEGLALDIENTRNRRHTAELAVVNVERDLERMRERGKEALQDVEGHRSGKEALQAQLERVARERDDIAVRTSELERDQQRLQSEGDELHRELAELTREQERVEQRVVQARIELAQLGARRDQQREARERLERAEVEARDWIARRREEVREAGERAEQLGRSAVDAQARLDEQIEAEAALRGEQTTLRERFEGASKTVDGAESAVREAVREREELRDRIAHSDLAVQEARMKAEQVSERVREFYDIDIAHYQPSPEHLEGEPAEREAELDRLREQLRSLGDVNVGAIEEYEEVSERFRYLSEQQTDLLTSVERLRNAIARINRTSRARFRETFDAIDAEFQRIFPRMFLGGRAHLTLTESEDVLESGIEITAQPPGKKLQNVNLLSGGEKSLTAISLLVAVFIVKPSPFFLLDEVDAALDEANESRFNMLIREMSEISQFIMISHNKGAIEASDTLFGVTMEEPGLSKLVTVDLVGGSVPDRATVPAPA